MSLWKRAYLYSIRKKGKTITLLAFLLVMATMMLTCLSIQAATETANANIKRLCWGISPSMPSVWEAAYRRIQ